MQNRVHHTAFESRGMNMRRGNAERKKKKKKKKAAQRDVEKCEKAHTS